MSTSPVNPVSLYGAASNPLAALMGNSSSTIQSTGLDMNAFLKLMITELQNQDPTQPIDSAQYASQLAQYSSLQEMTNMQSAINSMVALQTANESVALIGHMVAATDASGAAITGQVTQVKLTNGMPTLLLDSGTIVNLSSVTTVM